MDNFEELKHTAMGGSDVEITFRYITDEDLQQIYSLLQQILHRIGQFLKYKSAPKQCTVKLSMVLPHISFTRTDSSDKRNQRHTHSRGLLHLSLHSSVRLYGKIDLTQLDRRLIVSERLK